MIVKRICIFCIISYSLRIGLPINKVSVCNNIPYNFLFQKEVLAEPEKEEKDVEKEERDIEKDIEKDIENDDLENGWDIDSSEYMDDSYNKIISLLNLNSIDKVLRKKGLDNGFSFSDLVKSIANGDTEKFKTIFVHQVKKVFVDDLSDGKELIFQIIIIVLLGTIFTNISNSIGGGFVSENGFYMSYMIICGILLTLYFISITIAQDCISSLIGLLKVIVPVYGMAMNYIGQPVTATGLMQVVMLCILFVEIIIKYVVLSISKYYVMITIINNVNKEDLFSKLTKTLKNASTWILKTLVVIIVGFNIVKSLINPQLDAIGRETIKRVVSIIPGGNLVSVLSGTLLGSGVVIKNSIGIAGMVMIICVVAVPVIKILLLMIMVRISAIVVQPLGESRYVNSIEALTNGLEILLQAILSAVSMFLLTIALMSYGGKS